jgi:hypothetical protein
MIENVLMSEKNTEIEGKNESKYEVLHIKSTLHHIQYKISYPHQARGSSSTITFGL